MGTTTTTMIEYIQHYHDYAVQVLASFAGALFAFLFFLLGDWIKRRIDRKRNIRNEHAHVERYLLDLDQVIQYNKGVMSSIIEDYSTKPTIIDLQTLLPLPVREEISMKVNDFIFINRIEIFTANLKRLNKSITNINLWKEKIDSEIISESEKISNRALDFIPQFNNENKGFIKIFDFYLSEVRELLAENRILLKENKNWHYDKEKIEKKYADRKNEVRVMLDQMKNEKQGSSVFKDYFEKMKKFGINHDGEN